MMRFFLLLFLSSTLYAQVTIQSFYGEEILPHVKELKALCHKIHCGSPYVYNGHDAGYDSHLQNYTKFKEALVCVAYDDKKPVGMIAAMPLKNADPQFQRTLDEVAHDVTSFLYLGEFGVHPDYEEKGIEERLYTTLEGQIKENSQYKMICFWEIEDTSNPGQKPPGMIVRDQLWKKFGFSRRPKLQFLVSWTNIHETAESPHLAIYWTKKL